VFWYGASDAGDRVWDGGPRGQFSRRTVSRHGGDTPVTGDFDGDGSDDVFFYPDRLGAPHMNPRTRGEFAYAPPFNERGSGLRRAGRDRGRVVLAIGTGVAQHLEEPADRAE
jgi:hypothetical protein